MMYLALGPKAAAAQELCGTLQRGFFGGDASDLEGWGVPVGFGFDLTYSTDME